MKKLLALTLSITAVGLLAFEGRSPIAQDTGAQKYSLQVPDGLRFDEFRDTRTGRSSRSARSVTC
jgi:hypothetical protein